MARRLLLLLALGGCDRVWGLERPSTPPVCGPFMQPVQVELAPALGAAHDFSIDPAGTHAMVHANLTSGALTWDGPHAIVQNGDGVWIQDPARDRMNLDQYQGGHIISEQEAIAWLDMPRPVVANLLEFNSTVWGSAPDLIDAQVADRDLHIGNIIDLPVGQGLVQRFGVEIRPPADFDSIGQIAIIQRNPTSSAWQQTTEVRELDQADPPIDMNGGVLAASHDKLVYSGKMGSNPVSRIYATARKLDEFKPGGEVVIDGVKDDADLTEPWINGDCTELYFHMDDATWFTMAVTQ